MSLTIILTLSSYIYLISTILIPFEMTDLTAQFMSIITTLPTVMNISTIITHISKSIIVIFRFIVLFTILGVNAMFNLFKKNDCETISLYKKNVIRSNNNNNNNNNKITPIMQPTADVTLKSPIQKNMGPIITNNKKDLNIISDEPINKLTIVSKEPTTEIKNQTKTTIENNTTNNLSNVVHNTLVKDQLTLKQDSSLTNHVTSPLVIATTDSVIVQQQPEESIPSLKSDNDDGDEEDSNSIHDSIKQSSDVSKEQYYSNLIKKDNNLMSLSDNLQRIFDEPSTPIPLNQSLISDSIISNNDTGHYNKRPGSIQTSLLEEETALTTTTPALTPPNPSSTVSRKSSLASQKSSFKGMFNSTLQKISRKSSINSQNEPLPQPQPQKQQQQQQTIMPEFHDLTASTSTKRLSRLSSTFRLGRKKSTASNTSKQVKQVLIENEEDNTAPVKPMKSKSFTSKMKSKLNKLVKKS